MGIGADIKEVLEELGIPIVIYKADGSIINGEFCDPESYYEHSTEFIRQNCYAGTFAYDTNVTYGDIISFTSMYFLMLNVKPTLFERENVDVLTFFVECNVLGKFSRFNPGLKNSNYEKTGAWEAVQADVRALQVDGGAGADEFSENATILGNSSDVLYCSEYSTIKVGDRWYPDLDDLTEYYVVTHIQKRKFKGCLKIKLKEDSR